MPWHTWFLQLNSHTPLCGARDFHIDIRDLLSSRHLLDMWSSCAITLPCFRHMWVISYSIEVLTQSNLQWWCFTTRTRPPLYHSNNVHVCVQSMGRTSKKNKNVQLQEAHTYFAMQLSGGQLVKVTRHDIMGVPASRPILTGCETLYGADLWFLCADVSS